jgi:hypothetical protein
LHGTRLRWTYSQIYLETGNFCLHLHLEEAIFRPTAVTYDLSGESDRSPQAPFPQPIAREEVLIFRYLRTIDRSHEDEEMN